LMNHNRSRLLRTGEEKWKVSSKQKHFLKGGKQASNIKAMSERGCGE